MNIDDFVAKCRSKEKFRPEVKSRELLKKSAEIVENAAKGEKPVYGVNTGLGALCNITLSEDDIAQFQKDTIVSHACGFGEPAPKEIAKGALLLLINSLSKGYSGVREKTFDTLVDLYNADLIPVIPSKGSVGASGDLAPMAHLALALTGQGNFFYRNGVLDAREVLRKIKRPALKLKAKEAISLINGTYLMASYAAFAVSRAENLLETATVVAACSIEALKATDAVFSEEIHFLKPHHGQMKIASTMREYLKESEIIKSHKNCSKVQDPYSLRCIPQVHGAVLEAISCVKKIVETEMNSVTDNPLVFPDGAIKSGGNFQGYFIASFLDFLKIVLAGLANISFQRIGHLINSSHLPLFLSLKPGLDSGFMAPEIVCGSMLTEIKILAQPASIHNVSLSLGQEDFNSMGTISARQAYEIGDFLARIIATEMLAAILALEIEKNFSPGPAARILREIAGDVKKGTILETLRSLESLILGGKILEPLKNGGE